MKILRTDGGGKYTGNAVKRFLEDWGIGHEITTPDMLQHNSVAEQMNWTLLDKVQALLMDVGLPESYWYNALSYAAYLHNISPTRALDSTTPDEAWSRNKPDISWLCVFRSQVFVHIPDKLRSKLGAKSLICTFIGYAQQRKAYHLVHCPTGRFLESCDIIFDEWGPEQCYKRIILKHNSMDSSSPSSPDPPSSTSSLSLPAQPTEPIHPSPSLPSPPARLKHTTCTLICDDDQ
jgi:hypothetical protein